MPMAVILILFIIVITTRPQKIFGSFVCGIYNRNKSRFSEIQHGSNIGQGS